jgi:hypothetical protein
MPSWHRTTPTSFQNLAATTPNGRDAMGWVGPWTIRGSFDPWGPRRHPSHATPPWGLMGCGPRSPPVLWGSANYLEETSSSSSRARSSSRIGGMARAKWPTAGTGLISFRKPQSPAACLRRRRLSTRARVSQRNGRDRETETQRAHPSPILTNTDPNQVVQPPPRGKNLPLTRTPTTGTAETPRPRAGTGRATGHGTTSPPQLCSVRCVLRFCPGARIAICTGRRWLGFRSTQEACARSVRRWRLERGREGAPGFRAVCVPVCGL